MSTDFQLKLYEQNKCPQYKKEQLHIFDDLPSGVLINIENEEGGLEYAYSNPFLAKSLGYTHQEFSEKLKRNCFAAIYEGDRDKTMDARNAVLSGKIADSISRQVKKDGTLVWILAHVRQIELDGTKGILLVFSRIDDLINSQNELLEKSNESNEIVQSIPMGLMVYKEDNGVRTVLSVNKALLSFANTIGNMLDSRKRNWTAAEFAMIMKNDIYAFCEDEDIESVADMLKNSEGQMVTNCTFRLRGTKDTNPIFIHSTCASKETGENCRTYYVTYQNVTDDYNRRTKLIEKQSQLYQMSYYDALTNVRNRNAFNQIAENCETKPISNVGLLFCDINGLKLTNDTLGHHHGDNMIKHFASILKEYFEVTDIYRLSGDEFVVINSNISKNAFQNKMKSLLRRSEEEEENIASIGYIWKEKVSNIQRRTNQAEQIMYVEKQHYYEKNQKIDSKHRPRMLLSLMKDFEEKKFVMYLQPKTSIDGKKIIGAEALVRKYEDNGSIILPYAFVPQLEYEKLIPKLDYFMLEETCDFLQKMHIQGNDDFSVSVNISRVTIVENDFLKNVTEVLNKYDFDRSNIEFELTESNKTMDPVRLEDCLIQLKKLGVKISLDDMGNDYSSLNLLTLEGFNWVKLDRSLIIQLNMEKAQILVKHLINTCHDLNLQVIAEGVETDEVRLLLKSMNCDAYQGYLKSKPIPVEEFKEKFL